MPNKIPAVTLGAGINTIEGVLTTTAVLVTPPSAMKKKRITAKTVKVSDANSMQVTVRFPCQTNASNAALPTSTVDSLNHLTTAVSLAGSASDFSTESPVEKSDTSHSPVIKSFATVSNIENRTIACCTYLFYSLAELRRQFDTHFNTVVPHTRSVSTQISLDLTTLRKQSSQEIYYVLALNCTEQVSVINPPYEMTKKAQTLLAGTGHGNNKFDLQVFFQKYGDSYIDTITYGRFAVVIMQFQFCSKEQKKKVSGQLALSVGSAVIAGGLASSLQKTLQDQQYYIHLFTRGMDYTPTGMLASLDEIDKLIKNFSVEKQVSNFTQMGWTTASYLSVLRDRSSIEKNVDSEHILNNTINAEQEFHEKLLEYFRARQANANFTTDSRTEAMTALENYIVHKGIFDQLETSDSTALKACQEFIALKRNATALHQYVSAAREVSLIVENSRRAIQICVNALHDNLIDTTIKKQFDTCMTNKFTKAKEQILPQANFQLKILAAQLMMLRAIATDNADMNQVLALILGLAHIETEFKKQLQFLLMNLNFDANIIDTIRENVQELVELLTNWIQLIPTFSFLPIRSVSRCLMQYTTHKRGEYKFNLNLPDESIFLKMRIINLETGKSQPLSYNLLKLKKFVILKKYDKFLKFKRHARALIKIKQSASESEQFAITEELDNLYFKPSQDSLLNSTPFSSELHVYFAVSLPPTFMLACEEADNAFNTLLFDKAFKNLLLTVVSAQPEDLAEMLDGFVAALISHTPQPSARFFGPVRTPQRTPQPGAHFFGPAPEKLDSSSGLFVDASRDTADLCAASPDQCVERRLV